MLLPIGRLLDQLLPPPTTVLLDQPPLLSVFDGLPIEVLGVGSVLVELLLLVPDQFTGVVLGGTLLPPEGG
jgi:hypothetical protein